MFRQSSHCALDPGAAPVPPPGPPGLPGLGHVLHLEALHYRGQGGRPHRGQGGRAPRQGTPVMNNIRINK